MNKALKMGMRLILGAILLTSSSQIMAERLDLSKGTMSIHGTGGVVHTNSDIATNGIMGGTWGHKAEVGFGYFVIDRLALIGMVNWTGNFSQLAPTNAGLGLGVQYFFDTKTIVSPYLGVAVLGDVLPSWSIGFRPDVGILIALNQHVAVDLGLNVAIKRSPAGVYSGLGNLGFIGVRGFF